MALDLLVAIDISHRLTIDLTTTSVLTNAGIRFLFFFHAEAGIRDVAVTGVQFFFSSRRRHTRCSRDWSSDVCSSDLYPVLAQEQPL